MSHNCPGPLPAAGQTPNPTRVGAGLGYYLREAWRIIRWDDAAIREVMDDRRSLPYGVLIWTVANTLPLVLLLRVLGVARARFSGPQIVTAIGFALVFGAIYGLVHMGICHLIAKYFCAGEGKFMQM